ncbi:hypothetical protein Tco_1406494 [Tanacetum coccineum]
MIPLLHKGDFLLNKDLRLSETNILQELKIQVLYEKVKRFDENFISIGFVEDKRLIKDLNKKAAGIKNADSIKEENKEEGGTKKRKLGTRKKIKSRKRRFRQDASEDDETNSEKENDELRLCLIIASNEDKKYDETKDLEEINLNVVIRSNGQSRYFSNLMSVLSIFDREDLSVVYQLVMDRYQDEIPEGLECKLKLESEEDSTMALELIRFVKKLIAELEPENSNGDKEDL